MTTMLIIRGAPFVFVTVLITLGFTLSQQRDTQAPTIRSEVITPVLEGERFTLRIQSDERADILLRYGDTVTQNAGKDIRADFRADIAHDYVEIRALDEARNETVELLRIHPIAHLEVEFDVPEAVLPGNPFSVLIRWNAEDLGVKHLAMAFDGQPLPVFARPEEGFVLASIPLGQASGISTLSYELTDEYDRIVTDEAQIVILEDPKVVEELNLSAATFSVVTTENRDLEADIISQAYATATQAGLQWREPFQMPIEGIETSGFGDPRRYVSGGAISYHRGADIAAPLGTPVYASNSGIVQVAEFLPIKGGFVMIDHGGEVFSLYLHQSRLDVEAGDYVERGQKIGEVGSTGLSTGPHLHWEMQVRGEASNPLAWVGKILP